MTEGYSSREEALRAFLTPLVKDRLDNAEKALCSRDDFLNLMVAKTPQGSELIKKSPDKAWRLGLMFRSMAMDKIHNNINSHNAGSIEFLNKHLESIKWKSEDKGDGVIYHRPDDNLRIGKRVIDLSGIKVVVENNGFYRVCSISAD